MELLGVALSILGLVPIVLTVIFWSRDQMGVRRIIRLAPKEALDLVVTTSAYETSILGASIRRPLTGLGQLIGASYVARFVGRYYRSKELKSHMSARVRNLLERDLVLLGGPLKNEWTRQYLDAMLTAGKNIRLDDNGRSVFVGDSFELEDVDLRIGPEGFPHRDLGLIIVWRNPNADTRWRRGILCAGFTSYGTASAAEFLFDHLLAPASSASGVKESLRKLARDRELAFVSVVEFQFSDGAAVSSRRVLFHGTV